MKKIYEKPEILAQSFVAEEQIMLELDTSGRGYLDIYDDLNLDAISD
jgi:hypothetical protein